MTGLRYLSLFSGIEACSVAWEPLGWTPVAFAEIEPFPCALLAHRFPHVPNLGDVTQITDAQIAALGPINLVVGGSPCQDLSVAGKRAGLVGARSSLFHEQVRLFNAARTFCGARWLVWENVPGAFSTHDGRDFAVVVGALAGCELPVPVDGWGSEGVAMGPSGLVEWGVLDAQHFGVAQRRRRVFAVLDAGDWPRRPPILLEPESLRGDPPTRGEAREGTSGGTLRSTLGGSDVDHARAGHLMPQTFGGNNTSGAIDVATAVRAHGSPHQDFESETFVAYALRDAGASEDGTGHGTPIVPVAGALPADPGMKQSTYVAHGVNDADAEETGPVQALRALRDAIGQEAFIEWRAGIVASLRSPEVLRQSLHVGGVRREADEAGRRMDDRPLSREEDEAARTMREMREAGRERRTPSGRGLSEQYARELNAAMSRLPSTGAPPAWLVRDLRAAGEGEGLLRATLSSIPRGPLAVRRLTPTEAERLQGFPDGWTAIPVKRVRRERLLSPRADTSYCEIDGEAWQLASDGPRYKALGNSMAVPCIAWIGRQIERAHRWRDAA